MTIETKYSLGDTVVVQVDGSFVKAKVQGLSVYLAPEAIEPVVNYNVLAKWQGEVPDKNGRKVKQIYERRVIVAEQTITELLRVYAKLRKEIEEPTEAKILWKMSARLTKGS